MNLPAMARGLRKAATGGAIPMAYLLLLAMGCQESSPATQRMVLEDGWEFSLASEPPGPGVPVDLLESLRLGIPGTVPGTVHTDLLENGLIADPFWGDEELALQWVGTEDWSYRTTFQATAHMLEKEVVDLVFHGLDTYAEVLLNDEVVLRADNMFRTWTPEVSGEIRLGENHLEIRFSSPIAPALEARSALPYELPAGNDRGTPPSRVFVRKAAYHYGWDWGPRYVTSGIWRPVEVVAWSGARLTDLHMATDSVSESKAFIQGTVEVEVSREEAERRSMGGGLPLSVTVSSPDGAFEDVVLESEVQAGRNVFAFSTEVEDPILWWSNGLGDSHLYPVQATIKAGRRADTLSTRLGIRTLELVTEPDSIGETFYFRLNGVPVFMKGANVIPLDHFSPRVSTEEYRSLFADVVGANMNMLRVWGGGIYETELFYELADENGILIWQDFMFANGMYPGDSLFLASVEAEAADQVRRLRSHPSLALWCGNNEMDEGWNRWGWARDYDTPGDSAEVRNSYERIFHEILPGIVEKEDPHRRYWPSSPSLGWGDPESLNRGDSHYWGVWHGEEPFQVFTEKLPRFSSEFGFQAFPSMETVAEFTDSVDRALDNPTLLVHQKHPIGTELISTYMERDFPVPASFQDFVYVSQLVQARGMRMAFEAHRRAMPRTMGTLYWQLNDTWPVVSWSSRDYFGRWKALHYAARDAFEPVLVSAILRGDTVEVWGVSDRRESVDTSLRLELVSFDGTILWESTQPTTLSPGSSTLLWKGSAPILLGETDSEKVVLVGAFTDAGTGTPNQTSLLYFHPPKELDLGVPTIRLEIAEDTEGLLLSLESDVLAKDVYLALDGAHFSDNYFDILPGRPHLVRMESDLTADEAEAGLSIKTLAEIPREGVEVKGT